MRFVPANCLKDGMIVGKQLMGKNGELLLNSGAVIRSAYIERIRELGYSGIYIDDDLSRDVEITELISDTLRFRTIKTLKNAFNCLESGKDISKESFNSLSSLVNSILDEITSSKDIMVNMLDMKVFDDYTFYHSLNVTVLSLIIGISLRLSKDQLYKLGLASLLHDIGKVFMPKEILNKPGRLTDVEFEIMCSHSLKGYEYLKDKSYIPAVSYIGILHHHEKYDGNGYPLHFDGKKISLFGRIIAVADVYDALTSDRPYRKAMIPSEAIEYIMGGGGSLFDPEITACFVQKVAPYPVGTHVILSDNRIGLVLENHQDCCVRPKIKIIKHGLKEVEPYIIDLRDNACARNVTIAGMTDRL